jgi:hypothetical protein
LPVVEGAFGAPDLRVVMVVGVLDRPVLSVGVVAFG